MTVGYTGKRSRPCSVGEAARDAYLTREWATQEPLKGFPELTGRSVLDPCCGDGRDAARYSFAVLAHDSE